MTRIRERASRFAQKLVSYFSLETVEFKRGKMISKETARSSFLMEFSLEVANKNFPVIQKYETDLESPSSV